MAMKVARQARLELSGGSTPDQLRPQTPPPPLPLSEIGPFCIPRLQRHFPEHKRRGDWGPVSWCGGPLPCSPRGWGHVGVDGMGH